MQQLRFKISFLLQLPVMVMRYYYYTSDIICLNTFCINFIGLFLIMLIFNNQSSVSIAVLFLFIFTQLYNNIKVQSLRISTD
jgi:uncharacterized membrane protein